MNLLHDFVLRSRRWDQRLRTRVIPWVLQGAHLGPDVLEIGPGPGLTTSILREHADRLTCIEVDEQLATRLSGRFADGDVTVVHGDATSMPFETQRFSAVVSLTMLHHVPSAELQDRLFTEAFRVLAPAGTFLGFDSTQSRRFRFYHLFDTCVPVDPQTLGERLERAGFADIKVRAVDRAFRFAARRPP